VNFSRKKREKDTPNGRGFHAVCVDFKEFHELPLNLKWIASIRDCAVSVGF
jgi:hypothetical protein